MTEVCYNHPNSKARYKCNECGRPICPTCVLHSARHTCPQCAGHFPSTTHQCTNHPENFASFTCLICGKPFCKQDKIQIKKSKGNYIYNIWTGCSTPKTCEHYREHNVKMGMYKQELKNYLNQFKGKKCSNCGTKYSRTTLLSSTPVISKILDFFALPSSNPTIRIWCKKCKIIIPFLCSMDEFNGLDYPKLLENAEKPMRKRPFAGKSQTPQEVAQKLSENQTTPILKEKWDICFSTWNEALEYQKSHQAEIFIQKAYTAIENGISSLFLYEFDTNQIENVLLDDLVIKLRAKGYLFPDPMEFAYWRRLRNDIVHNNTKISEIEGKKALLFFKDIIFQIKQLNLDQ